MLKEVQVSPSPTSTIDRKIVKSADVTMEVDSPLDSQRKVSSIAGSRGGFVLTSESKRRESSDPNRQDLDISLVIRVPSAQFEAALAEIRGIGIRILQNKEAGQDVTEEFIDLEARINTQKGLESQFLQIMKQANKVADALEVQRQIAEVRNEIERLEGRRRFLDNNSSLSTITVNLQSPRVIIVSTSGFGQTIKDSFADSMAVASSIVLFIIRATIVLLPILVMLVLPAALVARYFWHRARRFRLAQELEVASNS
jgi:hypothetical protein